MKGLTSQQQQDRDFIDALRQVIGLDPLHCFNKPPSPTLQWFRWMDRITFEKPAQTSQRQPRRHK